MEPTREQKLFLGLMETDERLLGEAFVMKEIVTILAAEHIQKSDSPPAELSYFKRFLERAVEARFGERAELADIRVNADRAVESFIGSVSRILLGKS